MGFLVMTISQFAGGFYAAVQKKLEHFSELWVTALGMGKRCSLKSAGKKTVMTPSCVLKSLELQLPSPAKMGYLLKLNWAISNKTRILVISYGIHRSKFRVVDLTMTYAL